MAETLGRRDLKKQSTWYSIRARAIQLFLAHGFESVSVDDIAEAAGVSRATFFNYFLTKEAVVFDADPLEVDRIRGLLDARPPVEPVWTSVQELMIAHLASLGERITVTRRLMIASPTLAASGLSLGDRLRPMVQTWLAERHPQISELDRLVLVDIAISAALTAFRLWRPWQGRAKLGEMIRHSLVLAGGDHSSLEPQVAIYSITDPSEFSWSENVQA